MVYVYQLHHQLKRLCPVSPLLLLAHDVFSRARNTAPSLSRWPYHSTDSTPSSTTTSSSPLIHETVSHSTRSLALRYVDSGSPLLIHPIAGPRSEFGKSWSPEAAFDLPARLHGRRDQLPELSRPCSQSGVDYACGDACCTYQDLSKVQIEK